MSNQDNKKELAFKKLLSLAKADRPTFDLCTTVHDYHKGKRGWLVRWYEPLRFANFDNSDSKKKQEALDETLHRLTMGDFPSTSEQMENEKHLFRLTLDAGANPNFTYNGETIFYTLVAERKIHLASGLAHKDNFRFSDNVDTIFDSLGYNLSKRFDFSSFTSLLEVNPFRKDLQEESKVFKTILDYLKVWKTENEELAYILFQKDIFPHDKDVFQTIEPVILQKDAHFFEKKKEQMIQRLTSAKTSSQIWSVLAERMRQKTMG